MNLLARGRTIVFPRRPLVMGILNLGAESFSGDSVSHLDLALRRVRQMIAEGADIIDVGAESAATGHPPMSEAGEIAYLLPFVRRFEEERAGFPPPADPAQLFPPLLSINTWRTSVVEAVLPVGGDLLNDLSALAASDANARVCAATGAALLLMHNEGEPKVWHPYHAYPDVMAVLETFFKEKIAQAQAAGVARDALVLDPGLGFSKLRDDNLRILGHADRLQCFERPVLLPVSRKTVIGEVLGVPPAERDAGTVACIVSGLRRGVQIFRVHNIRAAVQTIRTAGAVL
ncbi:MAG: dihydropteroate synthase [Chthoniobacteraceae bacterium]|nr:dihydropteroate synthase [Chthoniobacteraceae bacterium]